MILAVAVSSCDQSAYIEGARFCECLENDVVTATCETTEICEDVYDLQDMGNDGWDEGPGMMEDTVSSCCGEYQLGSMTSMSGDKPVEGEYQTCGAAFEVAEGELDVWCHNNSEKAF